MHCRNILRIIKIEVVALVVSLSRLFQWGFEARVYTLLRPGGILAGGDNWSRRPSC